MANDNPSSSPGTGVSGLIGRILGYVDKPWKAVFVGIVLVLGALGWGAWLERERLATALLSSESTPSLDTASLPAAVNTLLQDTDADIVAAWRIDLADNAAVFEGGRVRGGAAWEFLPIRVPAIVGSTNPRALINIIRGYVFCDGLSATGLVSQRFREDGIERQCLVPIGKDTVLAVIAIGWKQPPDLTIEEVAIGEAIHVADSLVVNR